jgi:hypothetical protein
MGMSCNLAGRPNNPQTKSGIDRNDFIVVAGVLSWAVKTGTASRKNFVQWHLQPFEDVAVISA